MTDIHFPEIALDSPNSIEDIDLGIFEFLEQIAPHRIPMLESIYSQLSFPHSQRVLVDANLPMNVGGYYEIESGDIALNASTVLFGSEGQIAHVLAHEGLHAGVFSGGEVISDEPLTELLTKRIVNSTEVSTAYDPMVNELWPYLAELSVSEIISIVEAGNEESLNEFIELVVIYPMIEDCKAQDLSYSNIKQRIYQAWPTIQKLFPRALNQQFRGRVDAEMDSAVSEHEADIEARIQRIGEKIVDSSGIKSTLDFLLSGNIIDSPEEALEYLTSNGFMYLLDIIDDQNAVFTHLNTLSEQGFAPQVPNPFMARQIES